MTKIVGLGSFGAAHIYITPYVAGNPAQYKGETPTSGPSVAALQAVPTRPVSKWERFIADLARWWNRLWSLGE